MGIRRVVFLLVALLSALSAMAFKAEVKTTSVGVVTISSEESLWSLNATHTTLGECEVITIEMSAPEATTPPKFKVEFRTPQLDAHHLWHSGFVDRVKLQPDWRKGYTSALAEDIPLYSFINTSNRNRLTVATSEAVRRVNAVMGLREEGALLQSTLTFFVEAEAPIAHYKTTILIDKRDIFWADAVRDAMGWIEANNSFKMCRVPKEAFEPLYSTWYQFHQQITDKEIEAECREAVKLGMRTIIVDDGWQTADNNRGYAYCGDWRVAPTRIADMAAHIKRVQDIGMKYMLWYSVPFVGRYSDAYKQFEGKFLYMRNRDVGVLDPRFPEVREYICATYERALREWNLDGFKLDFIDSFKIRGKDPAIAEGYAGRDIKSVSEAVNVLMIDVAERLQAIKPGVLIEFRQNYIGPAIRQYGNILRARDCPGDMQDNRIRIANLRLTSGQTAVHADMLEWNSGERPEVAARHILSALYGVVQYSVMLRDIPKEHLQMVKHWIGFSKEHRATLLHSFFRPYNPEALYPILEAESNKERIITLYQEEVVVKAGKPDREVYIINATGCEKPVVELEKKPRRVEYYDTYGNRVAGKRLTAGVQRVDIPVSGYIKLIY
ncbi:MAG: alpha-galactosidase [Alistipes sp.]|nr:alpha-galactosidase [Alistipes sp.]MBQ5836139.1 alpha-galactosidase [Alistipes sp.]